MTKRVEIVPIEYVQQIWGQVGHWIDAAMDHAKGECTTDQLRVYLASGTNQLMVYVDDDKIVGAVQFSWNTSPNDRIFYIVAIGGKTSPEHTEQMFNWARSMGATTVRGCARESVARLWRMKYGFDEIYRMVEKRL